MALDNRYIAASDLELYLVDKTTGLPMSNGTVEFYSDVNRASLKPVYTISGVSPNYSFVELPNPSTLSAVGTFQDAGQNNVIPYYFPYNADGDTELYYIVVKDQNEVVQFTREAWPPNVDNGSGGDTANAINYIPNGQFLAHTDIPEDSLNNIPFGQITQPQTEIAQGGWYFNQDIGTSSINNVQFFRFGEFLSNPEASPRYAVQVVSNLPDASDAYKDIRIRFDDVNKFSSNDTEYTITFNAVTFNSGDFILKLDLIKNFGTGGSPSPTTVTTLSQFTITGNETKFQLVFNFGSNEGEGIGANDDDYVELAFSFPINISFGSQLTDFALFSGSLASPSFPQTTQRDVMSRSLTPPTPNPDGSDLYLPMVLTKEGYGYDQSQVGLIQAAQYDMPTSLSPDSNVMLADGAQYYVNGYSDLGIPFYRLWSKAIWNETLKQPKFGTGDNFVTTAILNSSSSSLFFAFNSFGNPIAPIDGGTLTGFTFKSINAISALGYGFNGYKSGPDSSFIIANTPGHVPVNPAAGTSGFTITTYRNPTSVSSYLMFSIKAIAATTLASKYFTFESFPAVQYYMWFTVNGVGVDPALAGTGIKVELLSTYTAQDVSEIITYAIAGKKIEVIEITNGTTTPQNSFFLFTTTNASQYYVWFNKDNLGTDPDIAGRIGIEVAILTTDTSSIVSSKTMESINKVYFKCPNLQGAFLRGYDPNKIWDLNEDSRFTFGSEGYGNILGSLQIDDIIAHSHTYDYRQNLLPQTGSSTNCWVGTTTQQTNEFGGVETKPTNYSVNWVIRY